MLIQKGSREDAIHALINLWLKDPKLTCGWCGEDYLPGMPQCCEKPFIATNADIMRQFLKEKQMAQEIQNNVFASTDDKSMRMKLSFPPGLLSFLTLAFKGSYGEDLFTKEYNTTWFAKHFYKSFAMPERI